MSRTHSNWTATAWRAVVSAAFIVMAAPFAEGAEPAAEEALEAYVGAVGGREAHDQIHNRVTWATLEIPAQGIGLEMTTYAAKPNKMYTEASAAQLGRIEKGTDGEMAWERTTTTGARLLTGAEKEMLVREATFDRFVYWRDVYGRAELGAGSCKVDGRPCIKVHLVPSGGQPLTLYLDEETHLAVRADMVVSTAAGDIPTESYLNDYREVDGILLPHTVVTKLMGQERVTRIAEVRHNVELPADRFTVPEELRK